MSTTPPDAEKWMAELKKAPIQVRRVAGVGTLLGFLLLLRFCSSAYAGHVTWGRGIISGIAQFLLFWFLSFSVQDRRKWARWALLALIILQSWGALGHTMRLLRVTVESGLIPHGREALFDAAGVAQLVVGGLMIWLLLTKEVREHVKRRLQE